VSPASKQRGGAAKHGKQPQLRADRDSLPGSERGGTGGAAQHPPYQQLRGVLLLLGALLLLVLYRLWPLL
jgi:hypothetical protein